MRRLIDQLKRHEGYRGRPYLDSEGNTTIGYGRNLIANPLTEGEATLLLVGDVQRHGKELEQRYLVVRTLDEVRRSALLNMAYNLGIPRLSGFRRMWAAIDRRDWDRAAAEALDSKWARQVGDRAREIAGMLKTGEWP